MQISVTIEAPELASAIRALAESIGGQTRNIQVMTPAPVAPEFTAPMTQPVAAPVTPAPMAPGVPTQMAPGVPMAPLAPVMPAPITQPVAAPAAPLAPPPVPGTAAGTVPTTAQTYTMEQLAVAATQLVDAGRRGELVSLLAQFGVQALTALPKEQYGNFATHLRAMGARI